MKNNLVFIFAITSIILPQNQNPDDVLNLIKQKASSINSKFNMELEDKYSQAKTLERSGLYEESMLLYKEINNINPGTVKYYNPIKNYFKKSESWDSLLVYAKEFSKARNNDLQGELEIIDVYILMNLDNKWEKMVNHLVLESSFKEHSIKNMKAGTTQPI